MYTNKIIILLILILCTVVDFIKSVYSVELSQNPHYVQEIVFTFVHKGLDELRFFTGIVTSRLFQSFCSTCSGHLFLGASANWLLPE